MVHSVIVASICNQLLTKIVFYASIILIAIPLLVSLYHIILKPERDTSTNRNLYLFSISGIICFMLSPIGHILRCYDNDIMIIIPAMMYNIGWGIGEAMIHLLFIHRLFYAFLNTKYQPLSYVFYLCYIGIAIFIIIQLLICLNYIFVVNGVISNETFGFYDFLWSLLSFIVDTALCIYLMYIFIKKLVEIAYSDMINTSKNSFSSFSNHYQHLFNVITKYFILSSLGIISSELFYIIIFLADIYGWKGDEDIFYFMVYICWLLAVIDCVVNVYCIFLNLEFASRCYDVFCRGLHSCIKLYCMSITKKSISKQMDMNAALLAEIEL